MLPLTTSENRRRYQCSAGSTEPRQWRGHEEQRACTGRRKWGETFEQRNAVAANHQLMHRKHLDFGKGLGCDGVDARSGHRLTGSSQPACRFDFNTALLCQRGEMIALGVE